MADASAIRALTREAYAKWVPVIGREPKPMMVDYAEAMQKHRIDLLYLDGELAALIEMIPTADYFLAGQSMRPRILFRFSAWSRYSHFSMDHRVKPGGDEGEGAGSYSGI